MTYKVEITPLGLATATRRFEKYPEAENFRNGATVALAMAQVENIKVVLSEIIDKPAGCSCPIKKNDGTPFDGVSYYCPLHGR